MPDYPQGDGDKAFTKSQRRADDRQILSGIERERPIRAKKDTRKWCKGKVGIEHQPNWVLWFKVRNGRWERYTCVACGKVLDMRRIKEADNANS